MNQRIFIPLLILGALLPALLLAQPKTGKIAFTASVSKKEVVEGGLIEITFQLTGTAGGQLKVPNFGSFRQTRGAQEMSGMQFSGGNMQAHHTWVFPLMAPNAGDYTIPGVMAVVNGTTYRTAPVQVKVVPAGKDNSGGINSVPKGSNANLFITTEFSRSSAYVGQQVICTVNVYTKFNLAGIDLVSVPKAGTAAMKELERYDMPVTEETVGGIKYTKRAIYAAVFFPEKAGKITVPAVQANVAVEPTNIFSPTRSVRLSTEPVVLDIKALPVPAPEGFTGVVGEYQVEAKTDHDTAAVGEVFMCEISIRGNGNGRYFAPPKLILPQGLEVFDPVVKEDEAFENGRELVHRQVLEYAISAKQTGDYNCRPTIVWFDPDSSKFVSFSPQLTLKVVDADPYGANKVNPPSPKVSVKDSFWLSPKFIGAVSLGIAALLLLLYFLFIARSKASTAITNGALPGNTPPASTGSATDASTGPATSLDVVKPPRLSDSGKGLEHLLYAGSAHTFYAALYGAVKNAFAQQMGLQASTLSVEQVAAWMATNGYDQARISDLHSLFQTCEEALYGGQPHTTEMDLMLQKAQQFIRK